MGTPQKNGTHSADVQMELRLNGYVISVDQLGPDFFISRDTVDHPPAIGEMWQTIDGQERRWNVELFEGITAGRPRTAFNTQVSD